MRRLRPLAACLLALVLALTSGTMAVARGQATAVGSVVICSGQQGLVTIPVDAEGKPTGPAHICPDCALTFFAAWTAPQPVLVRPLAASVPAPRPPHAHLLPRRVVADHPARGPPVLS